jgi:hypothetical protein
MNPVLPECSHRKLPLLSFTLTIFQNQKECLIINPLQKNLLENKEMVFKILNEVIIDSLE